VLFGRAIHPISEPPRGLGETVCLELEEAEEVEELVEGDRQMRTSRPFAGHATPGTESSSPLPPVGRCPLRCSDPELSRA
jgi:hypothetical protein